MEEVPEEDRERGLCHCWSKIAMRVEVFQYIVKMFDLIQGQEIFLICTVIFSNFIFSSMYPSCVFTLTSLV